MKKILVTGGAGFVGSNLCHYLVDRGNFVYCLDNLFTGRMSNISDLISHKNFKFIEWDIQNYIDLEGVVSRKKQLIPKLTAALQQ